MIKAAAATFQVIERVGAKGAGPESPIEAVHDPLDTTVTYLEGDGQRIVLITSHLLTHTQLLYRQIQRTVKNVLGLPGEAVMVISSHNHSYAKLSEEPQNAFWSEGRRTGRLTLTGAGKQFFTGLERTLRKLPKRAVEVSVSWAMGRERRISYNRKGRRADGTTYFMREEDRVLLGRDFCGDIDDHAPVVCLSDQAGRPVVLLAHFNAHPATAFHPEHRVVCGEYPQTAAHVLAEHYANSRKEPAPPVAFLQGCGGDTNSKALLSGDVALSEKLGRDLGSTYVKTAAKLQPSQTNRLGLVRLVAEVPLARLPSERALLAQKQTIEDFIGRARSGDEDTLECIGLNFPRRLSPKFRADIVDYPLRWTNWALRQRRSGKADLLASTKPMEVCVLRLGDVCIAGLPGEAFVGIARQIRSAAIAPLTIPCGYTNVSYGYVPDGPNCGDGEYMSAFHLYTTSRPDYRKPAGDMLARAAVKGLKQLFRD
jgi:hypothetical protein